MIDINFASRKPIYEQIYDGIIKQAMFGALQSNEKLPSVRALAAKLGINPNTVSKAYANLERDGYIYSTVGRGSFISDKLDSAKLIKNKIIENFINTVKDAKNSGISIYELKNEVDKIYEEDEV